MRPLGHLSQCQLRAKLGLNAKPMKASTSQAKRTPSYHHQTPNHPLGRLRHGHLAELRRSRSHTAVECPIAGIGFARYAYQDSPPPARAATLHMWMGACAATPTSLESKAACFGLFFLHFGRQRALQALGICCAATLIGQSASMARPLTANGFVAQHERNFIELQMKNFNAMHWSFKHPRGSGGCVVEWVVERGEGEGGGCSPNRKQPFVARCYCCCCRTHFPSFARQPCVDIL